MSGAGTTLRQITSGVRQRLLTRRRPKHPPGSTPPTLFVLLSEERIGTDRLTWLLRQQPDVVLEAAELASDRGAEPGEQLDALGTVLDNLAGYRVRAAGVAVSLDDVVDREGLREMLVERRPKVIVLRHRNLVRVTLFHEAATRQGWLGAWNKVQSGRGNGVVPPKIRGGAKPFGPQRFTTSLRSIEVRQIHLRRFVDRLDLDVFEISEEDMLADERAVLAGVLGQLGVGEPRTDHQPLRAADERYLDVYEDIEAVHTHLEDTPYDRMLDALRGS